MVYHPFYNRVVEQKTLLSYVLGGTLIFLVIFAGSIYIAKHFYFSNNIQSKNLIPTSPPNISVTVTPFLSQNATADWVTFENRIAAYSIKIPSHWGIIEDKLDENNSGTVISSVYLNPDPQNSNTQTVGISVVKNPANLTINQYINKYGLKVSNFITPAQHKPLKIDGYNAEWQPALYGGVFERDSFFMIKDSYIYEFALMTPPGQALSFDMFDKIIATFHFMRGPTFHE